MSTIRKSRPRDFAACHASNATAAESAPVWLAMISKFSRVAHALSCSTAAARNVSHAASVTVFPSSFSFHASLADVVVFPEPLTPIIAITTGFAVFAATSNAPSAPANTRFNTAAPIFAASWPCRVLSCLYAALISARISSVVSTPKSAV